MQLVEIPAGILIMGDDRLRDAAPQHRLPISHFRIGKFPVTNAEFAGFVAAGGYAHPEYWTAAGWKALQSRPYSRPAFWDDLRFSGPDQPVVGITWFEAAAYCKWLGTVKDGEFRLPSEAEWEYAARGSESTFLFPWGDAYERDRANTAETNFGSTTSVDRFPAGVSPFGVWDLSGNVFEWTLSKWGPNWQTCEFGYPYRPDDGREETEGSAARVMRGGSWFSPALEARCAFRSRYLPGSRASNIGFRVAAAM